MADPRDDPRTTEQLVRAAIDLPEEEGGWDAVLALHFRATEDVLRSARSLCRSAAPIERARGADILGQLGVPTRAFPEECLAALLELVGGANEEPSVLRAAAIALGHLHDPRTVPALLLLKDHPDPAVRYGVTFGLLGADHSDALAALIALSQDASNEVRDWATFGIGSQVDTDTPEIREALFQRTSDSHDDTRMEALVGLIRRRDPRVVSLVAREIASGYRGSIHLQAELEEADSALASALRLALNQK
jgi:HEAT repeat protein